MVFIPAFDLQLFRSEQAERIDEGAGQAGVGDQRDVVVDGVVADGEYCIDSPLRLITI
jgi:hypothetical protein